MDNDLGMVGLFARAPASAEMHFNAVLTTTKSMGDPEYEWRARYGLGRAALLKSDATVAERERRSNAPR